MANASAQPGILGWPDSQRPEQQPWLIRGDIAYSSEGMLMACEARGQRYLFKLWQTKRVEQLILRLAKEKAKACWREAGQGWEAVSVGLCLQSWRPERRMVVLRRQLALPPEVDDCGQAQLPGMNLEWGGSWYEHAMLVTNWEEPELEVIAQVYRDRAARGRAQFQEGVARQTRHAGPNKLRLVSVHGNGWKIAH
jgi:hypothetical protein